MVCSTVRHLGIAKTVEWLLFCQAWPLMSRSMWSLVLCVKSLSQAKEGQLVLWSPIHRAPGNTPAWIMLAHCLALQEAHCHARVALTMSHDCQKHLEMSSSLSQDWRPCQSEVPPQVERTNFTAKLAPLCKWVLISWRAKCLLTWCVQN